MKREVLRIRLLQIIMDRPFDVKPLTAIQLGAMTNKSDEWVKAVLCDLVNDGQICKVIVRQHGKQKGYCLPSHPMAEKEPPLKPAPPDLIPKALSSRTPLEQVW